MEDEVVRVDALRVETPISQNRRGRSQAGRSPFRSPTKIKDSDERSVAPRRTSSFLERVLVQQKQQEAYKQRKRSQKLLEQEQQQHPRKRKHSNRNEASPNIPAGESSQPSSPTLSTASRTAAAKNLFSVYSPRLQSAPDGLHYLEDAGENIVDLDEKSGEPLCVMLVQRRQYARPPRTAEEALDAAEGRGPVKEEVVVRYLPMADLVTALEKKKKQQQQQQQRRQRHASAEAPLAAHRLDGLHRVHDGKDGMTTMHLEVDADFSFLPEHFKADPHAIRDGGDAASPGESNPAAHVDSTATLRKTEPGVYDYFLPPPMRSVELLKKKHKGGLAYIKHKLTYTRRDLEEMARRDRRSYLTCERRFLFMKQLRRDLERRLENEHRMRRREERQRRLWGRLRHGHSGGGGGGGGGANTNANPLYSTDDGGNAGYDGNNLYIVGREIPKDLVQTFFTLNDEYDAFQRSMERRLARQRQERQGRRRKGRDGAARSTTATTTRASAAATEEPSDMVSGMMRWGDALLFPGQRPVDGYVVVTAGPRGMRGWRRVLTGEKAATAATQRSGTQQRRIPTTRHVDLYAMSQRAALPPTSITPNNINNNNNPVQTGSTTAQREPPHTQPQQQPQDADVDADDEADTYAYTRHFRYQLFYANDSDVDSEDDMLCGEASDKRSNEATVIGATGGRRRVSDSGPVNYGTGYYLPRPESL